MSIRLMFCANSNFGGDAANSHLHPTLFGETEKDGAPGLLRLGLGFGLCCLNYGVGWRRAAGMKLLLRELGAPVK